MKNWVATAAALVVSVASLRADVSVVRTMTMEGKAAEAMGSAQLPRMTVWIKGQKSRADIDVNGTVVSSIVDLATRQVITLNSQSRTATVTTAAAATEAAPDGGAVASKPDVTFTTTGKSQVVDGQSCTEHALAMRMTMADFAGGQMPPEAASLMQGVRMEMSGSLWVAAAAPGAAEFAAFHKAALQAKMLGAVTGLAPGKSGGLDKLMEAAAATPGIPYLTEMTMTFEGSGPMVEAMKQMGPMKMSQKVASLSVDPIPDDTFKVPDGYTIEKK